MKRLLFLLLLSGAVAINPEMRGRVGEHVQPVARRLHIDSPPHLDVLLLPLFRWAAHNEVHAIARELRRRQARFEKLPTPRQFQEYLREEHLSGRSGVDPWGGHYYLRVHRDSLVVGSPGPDQVPETADDLTEKVPRH